MVRWQRLTIQRLMVAILFILVFTMAVSVPLDSDTWWHIRAGEYIVEQGEILTTDPFSHTQAGEEWIDHSWGSQVLLYMVYELFGGSTDPGDPGNIGLALGTALLATVGMAFVYLMCEGNVYVRAFMVVIGTAAAAIFWSPRPQMMSFMLGALVLYLLYLYKRKHVDHLWFIPPIIAVWVNLHGGFAIAFIFMFGALAGEVVGNLLDPDDERVVQWQRLKKQALVTAVSIPVVVLNPYGVEMLVYPFRTVEIGVLQDFIEEWASPDFHRLQTWPFALLLLGLIGAAGLSSQRIDWTDLVLVTGTGFLALSAGRNIAVFAIAATPVLSRHVDAWLTDRDWQLRLRRTVTPRMGQLNWLLLLLVSAGAMVQLVTTLDTGLIREAQQKRFPVELADYLDRSPPSGEMFNSYNWGGYLMFAAPDVPVFVDGRTDLYGDAFLRDYLSIVFLDDKWSEELVEQDIGFVAIGADSPLAAMLRTVPDTWQEQQFDDGRSALFVRAMR